MKRSLLTFLLLLYLTWIASAGAAPAAPVVVEAAQTHTLQQDLMLDGKDVLEIRGTAEKPCTLVGNRHRTRSGTAWTGSLRIVHCTIRDLGGLPQRTADGLVSAPGAAAI